MPPSPYWLYIGNTAATHPQSIFVTRFDPATGALGPIRPVAPATNPNFLARHPTLPILYAVTDTKLATYPGAVEAFAIDSATGNLTLLNRQPSGGQNPAHLAIDPTGQLLTVANYDGATVAAFPLQPDGHLAPASANIPHQGSSIHPDRQQKPYPHGVTFDPTGRLLFVPDLGSDKIITYAVDPAHGTLMGGGGRGAASLLPGSGPRHITLDKTARFAYVINELTSTLAVFANTAGQLQEIQTLAPWSNEPPLANTGSEIEIHPNGRFLYASNRGHDSLALCAIDPTSGKLTTLARHSTLGKTPRHFAIDPTGQFLLAANLRSNTIIVFRINPTTGDLTPTGEKAQTESPLCLVFVPIAS